MRLLRVCGFNIWPWPGCGVTEIICTVNVFTRRTRTKNPSLSQNMTTKLNLLKKYIDAIVCRNSLMSGDYKAQHSQMYRATKQIVQS